MKSFYHLNKRKFRFLFTVISLSFIATILLVLNLPNVERPIFDIKFAFILFTLYMGFCIVMLAIMFFSEYYYYFKQRKFFEIPPLQTLLTKYKFNIEIIYIDNKWKLAKEIRNGYINLYKVVSYWRPDKPKTAIFVIELEWNKVERSYYYKMKELFYKYGFELRPGFAIIETKDLINVEGRIFSLIELLKSNNFHTAFPKGNV